MACNWTSHGLMPIARAASKDSPTARQRKPARDRFDAVRGRADVPWRTDALMMLLRADD